MIHHSDLGVGHLPPGPVGSSTRQSSRFRREPKSKRHSKQPCTKHARDARNPVSTCWGRRPQTPAPAAGSRDPGGDAQAHPGARSTRSSSSSLSCRSSISRLQCAGHEWQAVRGQYRGCGCSGRNPRSSRGSEHLEFRLGSHTRTRTTGFLNFGTEERSDRENFWCTRS